MSAVKDAATVHPGWRLHRGADLFEYVTSGSRGWAKYYSADGAAFLRIGNLDHDTISLDLTEVQRVSPPARAEGQRTRVKPGDILISITADVGMVGLVPDGIEEAYINQHVALARLRNGVHRPFIAWFLASPVAQRQFKAQQRGATKVGLGLDDIRAVGVPVPPLPEQQRIVAEIEKQLTRLGAGAAALRRAQANLKRYRAAVLTAACEGRLVPTEAARWHELPLGDVITGIDSGKSFKCAERPPEGDEVGVIKVSAVTWGTFDEQESKTVLDSARVEPRYFVRSGDFLFSRANTIELVGACVIVGAVARRLMLSDKILRFRFTDSVLPMWVLYWLRSERGRREIERASTGNQASMRNIGQERIRNIAFTLPPLPEQHRIVAEVERRLSVVEELEAAVAASLARAARLRQAILQRAFSGELVPPEPSAG